MPSAPIQNPKSKIENMDHFPRHLITDEHGELEYRLAPGGTAEIVEIAVASPHRRTGVGRRLLERMIAELPPEVKTIYAFTSARNYIAHQWYRATGFTLTLLPRFYAAMGEDAYCCLKILE